MFKLLKSLLIGKSSRRQARETRYCTPRLEVLENRELMTAAVTDMTQLAQLFPRHSGPTILYLNFDGNTAEGVSPFQTTSGNRTQDMHEIMYRVSQMFTPFDVQVRRMMGDGQMATSGGNTTIFIGDKLENGTGDANEARAFVPFSDHAGQSTGYNHQLNSNPFDIGFVDPIFMGEDRFTGAPVLKSRDNLRIAESIAHEAGHTFGLGHILSDGLPDVMSYDADGNDSERFMNQTFNITDVNGTLDNHDSSVVPMWYTTTQDLFGSHLSVYFMLTQNSFTYLQAVLGSAKNDGIADVADSTTIDSTFRDAAMPSFSVGYLNKTMTSTIDTYGDYDVFQFSAAATGTVQIDVKRYGSSIDPVLMVYDSDGEDLEAFNDNVFIPGVRTVNSQVSFFVVQGETYRIVVGATNNASVGAYQLTVAHSKSYVVANVNTTLTLTSTTTTTTTSTSLTSTSLTTTTTRVSSPQTTSEGIILPSIEADAPSLRDAAPRGLRNALGRIPSTVQNHALKAALDVWLSDPLELNLHG